MTPLKAVGIVSGTLPWSDANEYLEACLYITTQSSCRDYVTRGALAIAIRMSNYAVDKGEEAAVRLIRETRNAELRSAN